MKHIAKYGLAAGVVAATLCVGTRAEAVNLSGGDLDVVVSDLNGALNSVSFFEEFYTLGTPVSDYGFQNGTSTSSFSRAANGGNTFGSINVGSVNGGGSSATVTGTYTGGGANVSFSKVYEIIDNAVLKTKVTLTNSGTSGLSALRYFFTADPDQGPGFSTNNNVLSLAGGTVAQATSGRSVVAGAVPGADRTGFSGGSSFFGLGISSGNELNNFFNSPFDPNAVTNDIGFGLGYETALAAGASSMFTYYQAFGDTSEAARTAFINAVGPADPIPTPALLPGLIGMGIARFRKKRSEATGEA